MTPTIQGHVPSAKEEARFWSKVDRSESGCWEWLGSKFRQGYGRFHLERRVGGAVAAHRYAYERLVEPIPSGLVLDHLCRNPGCVNPEHLEPVSHEENVRRGSRGRLVTVCAQGHPYTPENTYIKGNGCRACVTCRQARRDAWNAKVSEKRREAREANAA